MCFVGLRWFTKIKGLQVEGLVPLELFRLFCLSSSVRTCVVSSSILILARALVFSTVVVMVVVGVMAATALALVVDPGDQAGIWRL